jgi:hypothetical protein
MIRMLLLLLTGICGMAGWSIADPIKKTDSDKVDATAKECAVKYIAAMIDMKWEDALKYCDVPFRDVDGEKLETIERLKREFTRRGVPDEVDIRVGETTTLSDFNAYLKKHKWDELKTEMINNYEEYTGKDGRIVVLNMTFKNTDEKPTGSPTHLLVRVKDGKAHIVGVGGNAEESP